MSEKVLSIILASELQIHIVNCATVLWFLLIIYDVFVWHAQCIASSCPYRRVSLRHVLANTTGYSDRATVCLAYDVTSSSSAWSLPVVRH